MSRTWLQLRWKTRIGSSIAVSAITFSLTHISGDPAVTLAGEGGTEADLCSYFIHGPCTVTVDVVAPSAEDRQRFARYGPMPTEPAIAAEHTASATRWGETLRTDRQNATN